MEYLFFQSKGFLCFSAIMENKRYAKSTNVAWFCFPTIICMLNFCLIVAQAAEFSFAATTMPDVEVSTATLVEESSSDLKTYIVHVTLPDGKVFAGLEGLESWYNSLLPASTRSSSSDQKSRVVYSYHNVITGFAAELTQDEVNAMVQKHGEFVTARPQRVFALHTTHSPNFLGLHQNLGFWNRSNYGMGVIIGFLDTGITPDHPSFTDEGMPPPPTKWKGKCDNGATCNNKLIGARNFISGTSGPPVDDEGHGTHTASTAAGNFVKNANVFGQANGTAVGMAPLAHLAMYKVCDDAGCAESDILAAMDTAVEDGVDMLSLSLGGPALPFYADSIAVGAFGAIQKGIFVSCSAGNSGPFNASLSNEAPWILTVGASTVDRSIVATAVLGDQDELDGESLFQPSSFPETLMPLVYAGANADQDSAFCLPGSLNNTDVKGKVVLCERGGGVARIAKGQTVKDAGGAAMILMNQEPEAYSTLADAHVLPATHVSYAAGEKIKTYINSTSSPMATILFKGTVIGTKSAPAVTSFSSRGPSFTSPGILKPDIIGPGVSILAAWPISVDNNTNTKSTFNMISGTSMSCPHLSGIAALLKSAHPDWSPAVIKSAIMTTADQQNLGNNPIYDERLLPADFFALGAGHVNPPKANDPGLVYDLQPDDYVPYLCGLNYTDREVEIIVGRAVKCSEVSSISEGQLNYPSFAVALGTDDVTYTRIVTNVGEADSSYSVQVFPPLGVAVKVNPQTLEFSGVKQQKSYSVTFSRSTTSGSSTYVQGSLIWTSAKHSVRSPISIKFE